MSDALQTEIAFRVANGERLVTVKQFAREFAALGYTLDRTMDCRAPSRYLETGRSYPCCTTSVKESDTGISAWHYLNARRDANFKAMQALRSKIFAISLGAILEV